MTEATESQIRKFEMQGLSSTGTDWIAELCAALEAAGVIFVEQNKDGPGVRLRKPGGEI